MSEFLNRNVKQNPTKTYKCIRCGDTIECAFIDPLDDTLEIICTRCSCTQWKEVNNE